MTNETNETAETIAKVNSRMAGPIAENNTGTEMCDPTDESCEIPEMPDGGNTTQMQGGPGMMGGGMASTMTTTQSNEWLIPMTATGIISGTIAIAAAAICIVIWLTNKRKKD